MMSYVARSSNLSPHLRVITQSVASQVMPLSPPVVPIAAEKRLTVERPEVHTQQALNSIIPNRTTGTRIVSGPAVATQVRYAHTDIQIPDFSEYRRKSVLDPKSTTRDTADARRVFSYMIVASQMMLMITYNLLYGSLHAKKNIFLICEFLALFLASLQSQELAYQKNAEICKEIHLDSLESKRHFVVSCFVGGGVATVYCAKAAIIQFLSSMNPAADVLALSKVEVKLSAVPEGKSVTFKWRGKPLFVRHRTPEEIAAEQKVDIKTLRDPQHDSERSPRPQWLIVIGVCTHLGCVPIANAGDYGGYYCPCHGSHYDSSGRIRKGPAPLNLEIPEHEFPSDDLVIVG